MKGIIGLLLLSTLIGNCKIHRMQGNQSEHRELIIKNDKMKICGLVYRSMYLNYSLYYSRNYFWFNDSGIMLNLLQIERNNPSVCNIQFTELNQISGYTLKHGDSLILELKCLNEKCMCGIPDSLFQGVNFYFRKDTFENLGAVKKVISQNPNKYYQRLKSDKYFELYPLRVKLKTQFPREKWWN